MESSAPESRAGSKPVDAPVRAARKPSKFFLSSKLYLPLLTSLGLIVLFALYSFFYVSSQESYYNDHAFRVLSQLGDKFQDRIQVIRAVLAASTSPRYVPTEADSYILNYLRAFEAMPLKRAVKNPKVEPQRNGVLRLVRESGTDSMLVRAVYEESSAADSHVDVPCSNKDLEKCVSAEVNLEPATRALFERLGDNFFDDLLIANSGGQVIYQHATSGIRVKNLNSLVQEPEGAAAKGATSGAGEGGQGGNKGSDPGKTQRTRFEAISEVSNVVDIKLAGAGYKMYLLPLQVALTTPDATGQAEESVLTLCGLRSSSRVRTEALAFPYTHLIWASLVLLAAVALIWPVLKISYMSPKERLRHKHVVTLILSTFFATALLTLTALNFAYNSENDAAARDSLRSLADTIQSNIDEELTGALGALDAVSKSGYLLDQATKAGWNPQSKFLANFLDGGGKLFKPPEDAAIRSYPYFRYMFWVGPDGMQRFKIAVDSQSTPPVSIADRQYFHDVMRDNLSVSRNGKYRYRVEPVTSPNTGEFLVVLATQFTNPEKKLGDLKASVLVTPFVSLVDPIVPSGYGYAVVTPDGKVQFHSNSARNLIEDFTEECRPNSALSALLANGSQDWVDTNYMGRRQKMFVTPLGAEGLQNLSLVVFRDTNYFNTLNVTVVLVFSLILMFYAIPFVLAAVALVFRKAYPLQMIWPSSSERTNYIQVLASSLFLAIAFFCCYRSFGTSETLAHSVLLGLGGGLLPFLQKAGGWLEILARAIVLTLLIAFTGGHPIPMIVLVAAYLAYGWKSQTVVTLAKQAISLRYLYTLATVSILTVVVIGPCCGFFEVSYNAIHRLSLEREQLLLAKKLRDRRARIRQYYDNQLDVKTDAIEGLRLATTLDRHDYAYLNTKSVPATVTVWNALRTNWFQKSMASISTLFPSNQIGADLRELALAGLPDMHWFIGTTSHSDDSRYLGLETPPYPQNHTDAAVLSSYPVWKGMEEWGMAVLAVSCLVLGAWVFIGTKKVFLVELENAPRLDLDNPANKVKYRMIIGHPKSGKSTHARKIPGIHLIDIGKLAAQDNWTLERPLPRVIGLDRFEFDIDNPKTNAAKLHLLEQLIYVENRPVILLSTIDPMFYLGSQSPACLVEDGELAASMQLLDRWANVLSLFRKFQVTDKTVPQFGHVVNTLRSLHPDPAFQKLAAAVEAECSRTAQLRNIGVTILKVHQHDASHISKGKLLQEVLDRAETHYRVLWSTCTEEERLVLFQLAADGWANPNNERALQELQRRGLIQRSPGFQIMNESFRKFILQAQYPEEVALWEKEEKQSHWKAVKLSLVTAAVLIGCWLIYAEQDILNLSLGYVSAFAAAAGIVLKLLADFRGRSAA